MPNDSLIPPRENGRKTRALRMLRRIGMGCVVGLVAGFVLFAVSYAAFPAPLDEAETFPTGRTIRDREGNVLRVSLGPDDTDCRPWYRLDRDDWIVKAIVASEDKRFWDHPGADLRSLARAIAQNVTSGRRISGASTLTQQTVRLIQAHPRTLRWKYIEFFQALRMERARDKDWILSQYLNRSPFGSNLVGIEAASRGWFAKDPHELSLGEAALLAGIVQGPSRFRPDRHLDRALRRRDYVLDRMVTLGLVAPREAEIARAAIPEIRREARPFLHPHYCDWFLASLGETDKTDITAPLDPDRQRIVEGSIQRHAERLGACVAAVVADVATGEIRALACSGDYFSKDAGQVNTATAPRMAGSVFKPLLYARALDRGLLAPRETLPDIPRRFGALAPVDFETAFRGTVPADEALILSLNLPALEVAKRLGAADAVGHLRKRGFGTLGSDPTTYGIGIAVGNAPIRLVDLASVYAGFAAEARTNAAARIVSDILSGPERSLEALGHAADAELPRAAWKTGTSAAHRDAWTVLWTPDEVVAVWCGYLSHRFGSKDIVGIRAAAPLAWEIFRALHPNGHSRWYGAPPENMGTRTVCALSGLPPSADCPETRIDPCIPGRTAADPCPYHRRAADGSVETVWPKDIAAFFERTPTRLAIAFPRNGTTVRPADENAPILCEPANIGAAAELWWFADGIPAGAQPANRPFAFEDPSPGTHTVSCCDADGNAASTTFTVER